MQQPDVNAPLPARMPAAPISGDRVPVSYIGRRPSWSDRLYGSGLIFVAGQTRALPAELAGKLLRHADLFAPAAPEPDDGEGANPGTDDTEALLAQAALRREEQERSRVEVQALFDRIAEMDKDGLKDFALTHYQQAIPKTLTVENMRQRVIELIDQFGAI